VLVEFCKGMISFTFDAMQALQAQRLQDAAQLKALAAENEQLRLRN